MQASQVPVFMSASEADAALQRLCPALVKGSGAAELLVLALLYSSWEFECPTLGQVDLLLSSLPDYIHSIDFADQKASRELLAVSSVRVAIARERIRDDSLVLTMLNSVSALQASVFRSKAHAASVVDAALDGWRAATAGLSLSPAVAPRAPTTEVTAPAAAVLSAGHALELYQKKDIGRVWAEAAGEESNGAHRRLLAQMENGSTLRALSQVPDLSALDHLSARFPHFDAVLSSLRRSLALSSLGSPGKAIVIPPLLLRGPPGTGKSYFAQQLALALGCVYEERDLGVTSEAFVLTGMHPTWKYGKPGVVFDALVRGSTANPVICLNEVDKAKGSGTSNSPIQALYSLLEPTNSSRFKDEFAGVPIDASRVIWVLTANDGHIPEPILTRVEVFDIPYPSPAQCEAIAQSVWADLLVTAFPPGHPFQGPLPEDVCADVAHVSPRVMRRLLYAAAGVSALHHRTELTLSDVRSATAAGHKSTPRMGFLP